MPLPLNITAAASFRHWRRLGCFVNVDRRRSRRRRTATGSNIGRALSGILFGRRIELAGDAPFDRLVEEPRQIRSAPAAACARSKTFAQLPGPPRFLDPQKVQNLSLADVKAEADFVVELHGSRAPLATG